MTDYRVKRSFGDYKRGQKADLTQADAKVLLDAGYVAEIQTAEPAKKTAAPKK